eukprot:CAMPEP_0170131152 /NCGR_PEP_ID=MMETSP0020_2-20130122/23068_1 /TAXON_ID=98059 /ORGANISM="Dinobryon sp., Strain UTEXLB2267" /LENGTH=192 /DNA_ID=CAMNT_0010366153 /DNA_START=47 /DNA_END=625 /DNA_ORIENTATION=-
MSNIISIVEEIEAELKKPPDEQNEKLILFLKELKQEKQKQEERRRLQNEILEQMRKPALERNKDLIQYLKDEIIHIDNIGRASKTVEKKKSEINICGQDAFSSVISHLSQCFFGGYFSSRLASSSSTSFTQEMFLEPPRIPWIGSLSNKIPQQCMEPHPSQLVKDGLSSSLVGDDSSKFANRGGIQSLRRRK